MKELKIKAQLREGRGKSEAKKLRQKGEIPCVIYGHGEPAISASVKEKDFLSLRKRNPYGVEVVNIEIKGKETFWSLVKSVQKNPITDEILHIDFQHLHKGEMITVDIPVKSEGIPVGEKEGGILEQVIHNIKVKVLPSKIPSVFTVDISNLKIGQAIHIKDINIGDAELEDNPERVVFNVVTPRVVEEVKPVEEIAKEEKPPEEEEKEGEKQKEEEKKEGGE